ncbi:tetratricopeptide repeat protein [Acinetobacter shaoyimingii]|uniref:Tetratricopeptide repeat protein n=2 Tax=Acinetobacter shaoyimingii TaxID=2715164 RepID=A0A6G8RYU4_9GAMM|nr:tetratricopeptide repeat protein [Acinetobacter shaoyimingii]
MKTNTLLISFLLFMNISSASACINTYVFDLGSEGLSKQQALDKIKERSKKFKTHEELNDYGVLLIYAHQYDKAIQTFKSIENSHPNLAKTAANLGTAYELKGDSVKAKYWIQQGMKRDPNIHQGSEWIHVKILDAQLNQQKDKTWIQKNDVLGLDFGKDVAPKAKVKTIKFENHSYNLEKILVHSEIQMDQRLRFVNQDPIAAQIVFNMGNIEAYLMQNDLQTITSLFDVADMSGYADPDFLRKRVNYLNTSKWYAFKHKIIYSFKRLFGMI